MNGAKKPETHMCQELAVVFRGDGWTDYINVYFVSEPMFVFVTGSFF